MKELLEENSKCDAKVCRSCLNLDVRMCDIFQTGLSHYFSEVAGVNVSESDSFPKYICMYCEAFVIKMVRFRKIVQTSQNLMINSILMQNKITEEFIKSIDRIENKLVLPLTKNSPLIVECIEDLSVKNEQDNLVKIELQAIDHVELPTFVRLCPSDELDQLYLIDDGIDDFDINVNDDLNMPNDHVIEEMQVKLEETALKQSVEVEARNDNSKISKEETGILKVLPDPPKNTRKSNGQRPTKKEKPKKEPNKSTYLTKNRKRKKLNLPRWFEVDEERAKFEKEHNVDVKILNEEEQLKEFEKRKLSNNYTKCPYKCEKCYKGFESKETLRNHNLRAHDPSKGKWSCDICGQVHRIQCKLKLHSLQHKLRITCRDCNYTTCFRDFAEEHYQTHKGNLFKCEHCSKKFGRRINLAAHVRLLHPSTQVSCDICGEGFNGKVGLQTHRRIHNIVEKEEVPDLRCTNCHVVFKRSDALQTHLQLCDLNMIPCVECGLQFDSEGQLKEHQVYHRVQCSECDMTFANQQVKDTHFERIHLNIKKKNTSRPYGANKYHKLPEKKQPSMLQVCEVCGKTFSCKAVLDHHRRLHTGEKPYECDICHKTFRQIYYLQYHMSSHTGVRPYKCKYCPKSYASPSVRSVHHRYHMAIHTGIKPYKCKLCPKEFANPSVFSTHKRIHTGEKRFACTVCGKSFTQSSTLKLHVTTVHMKLPAPYKRKKRNQKFNEQCDKVW